MGERSCVSGWYDTPPVTFEEQADEIASGYLSGVGAANHVPDIPGVSSSLRAMNAPHTGRVNLVQSGVSLQMQRISVHPTTYVDEPPSYIESVRDATPSPYYTVGESPPSYYSPKQAAKLHLLWTAESLRRAGAKWV